MIIYQDSIIRITKGPQFEVRGGIFLFFMAFFILFFSGHSFLNREYVYGVLSLFLAFLLIIVVLDIRGIEIDHNDYRIREYKNLIGFKKGQWEDIRDYKSISISLKKLKEPTSEYSDHAYDLYLYYYVNLINEADDKELFLAEFDDSYKAREFAENLASKLNIRFE